MSIKCGSVGEGVLYFMGKGLFFFFFVMKALDPQWEKILRNQTKTRQLYSSGVGLYLRET